MRCREAKRRIDAWPDRFDRDVLEHIRSCSSCAEAAEAARYLKEITVREKAADGVSSTPLAEFRARAENRLINKQAKETIMSRIKSEVHSRPKLAAGLGLAFFVFLFITLVPFSYDKVVGYEVSFAAGETENAVTVKELTTAMKSLGYGRASIDTRPDKIVIRFLPNRDAARETAAVFYALTGYAGEATIKPMVRKVSGSLYAQVRDKYRVEVETAGKTDQEIAAEIESKLAAEGLADSHVEVQTVGDEMRVRVEMSRSEGDGETENVIELNLTDGDSISFDAPDQDLERLEIEAEGKSDEEIRAAIKERLAEQGIPEAEVEITTDAEGRRRIEVKVEKEEEKTN